MMVAAQHLRIEDHVVGVGRVSRVEPRYGWRDTHTYVVIRFPVPTYGGTTAEQRALDVVRYEQDRDANEIGPGDRVGGNTAWRSWVAVPHGHLFEVSR